MVLSLMFDKSLEKHLPTTSKTSSPDNLTIAKADLIGAVAKATIVSNIRYFLKNTHRVSFNQRK